MKLRHSAEMRDLVTSFFPKIKLILTAKATAVGSICSPGELHAAARYLAKALAEYVYAAKKELEMCCTRRLMRCIGGKIRL